MKIKNIDTLVESAMNFTQHVTSTWDSRLVGSVACTESADYIKEKLKSFCGQVSHQEFEANPGSFLGYIRINIALYILGLIALFIHQILLSVVLSTLAVIITVFQFFFYWKFVDFLFNRKTGKNVFGSIEPSEEAKQHIIISAHHDSAHIFNFLEKNPLTFDVKVRQGLLSMILMFVVAWILFFLNAFDILHKPIYWTLTIVLTLLSVFVIRLWFFYDAKRGTPGAGDNMICVAIALEIGKFFATVQKLKHTKVTIASWDGEECGLRGARAYCEQYQNQLLSQKTYNFNLECMYDHTEMNFLTSDLNNFVKLSEDMANEGVRIAEELKYPLKTKPFPLLAGGTDAAEFAKIGIEATTLSAMSWTNRTKESAYHTTRDTIDAVDKEAVKRSIEIGINYVLWKDKEMYG